MQFAVLYARQAPGPGSLRTRPWKPCRKNNQGGYNCHDCTVLCFGNYYTKNTTSLLDVIRQITFIWNKNNNFIFYSLFISCDNLNILTGWDEDQIFTCSMDASKESMNTQTTFASFFTEAAEIRPTNSRSVEIKRKKSKSTENYDNSYMKFSFIASYDHLVSAKQAQGSRWGWPKFWCFCHLCSCRGCVMFLLCLIC